MSHIVRQKHVILSDLAALGRALPKLGLQMRSAPAGMGFAYRWWGRRVASPKPVPLTVKSEKDGIAPHVLSVVGDADAYEAGLVKAGDDGAYTVAFDDYGSAGGKMRAQLGEGCGRLFAAYNEEVVTSSAVAAGYAVERTETDDEVVLTLGSYT